MSAHYEERYMATGEVVSTVAELWHFPVSTPVES
jgi:hypothetical protein